MKTHPAPLKTHICVVGTLNQLFSRETYHEIKISKKLVAKLRSL